MFEEYEVYVQASNAEGPSRPNRLKKRYGYSGEGSKSHQLKERLLGACYSLSFRVPSAGE